MAAITQLLGPVEARAWFTDVRLAQVDGAWTLLVPTSFKADWIRTKLDRTVAEAAQIAGLAEPPETRVRKA
jgi:chromosomal replication initiation ATPase DnaA